MAKYDAIVCLGGNVEPSGEPGRHARLRTDKAIELYQASVAPRIVFCGKWNSLRHQQSRPKTEAQDMADYAIRRGIPERNIILEEKSQSTAENIYFLRQDVLSRHDWSRVLIETSPYSLHRIRLIVRKILGKTINYSFDVPSDAPAWLPHQVREWFQIAFTHIVLIGLADGDAEGAIKRLRLLR